MSTKIGIIAEGLIDHALLPVLLERIAQDRAGYDWPVAQDDVAELFPIRKRGHGGVLETVRNLVSALSTEVYGHAFYVILLDRRTRAAQREVRKLLSKRGRLVLGIAIEEIEAWWLADRGNTLAWAGLRDSLPKHCRYSASGYSSERDKEPKRTLHELTCHSDRFDRTYGEGNVDMAREFAEDYWRNFAKLDDLRVQCPRGYRPFEGSVTDEFRSTARRQGRLF
jgi:hypothetical protein